MKARIRAWLALLALATSVSAQEHNTLTPQEVKDGWELLFNGKDLKGWRRYKKEDTQGWIVKDGTLHLEKPGSGDLITAKKYGDFEFAIDFKFETGNNSGIIYRCSEDGAAAWHTGPEMQVMPHKPGDKIGKTGGGSLYDMFAPTSNPFKGPQEWTTFKIVCKGKNLQHYVNGEKVVDVTIGSPEWNETLPKSKWKSYAKFATLPEGHIALQDHGGKLYYRNIKIRVLDGAKKE
jgi:hypothetical protein